MDIKTIHKTKIFNEFDSDMQKAWFYFKQKKFLYNIDTLYYTVNVDCDDWTEDFRALRLKAFLKEKRSIVEKTLQEETLWTSDLIMKFGSFCGFYIYHICKQDCFDIYISESVPNADTPPIFVQLRSQDLWLKGSHKAYEDSIKCLDYILKTYSINIKETQENRLDFAYHTNYIQNQLEFFSEKYIARMQISNFGRWHKEGFTIGDETYCDYFTLGRRKSNNVFVRVYNKTKEVVEMGYKQFFIWVWYMNGLISKFDTYVLEKCFEKNSWFYKDKARLEFYLEYGSDDAIKQLINEKLVDKSISITGLCNFANDIVPDVTIITNVEFQCKRKYFSSFTVPVIVADKGYSKRVYNILALQREFTNHLTQDVLRFVEYKGKYKDVRRDLRPTASWWNRLRNCKGVELSDSQVEIVREYQNKLDIKNVKTALINKIATFSVYAQLDKNEEKEDSFYYNVLDLLSTLNDNDLARYRENKNKKALKLGKQLEELEPMNIENVYSLINKVTGEVND